MLVYHGSDSNFRTLRISKSLVKHQSTLDNEGIGIYFSTDKEVARSYGKYIYSLYVNDKYLYDFRKKNVCRAYVSKVVNYVYKQTKVNIGYFMDLNGLIDRLYWGGTSICGVGREIYMCLDSCDIFWTKLTETQRQRVRSALNRCDKDCPPAYLFNYHIKNVGVIKNVSEDVVIIYTKENSY